MKIAIWHNLPSGGGKRALYDQVLGLLAQGHSVESWSPPSADHSFLALSQLIPEHILPINWPIKRSSTIVGRSVDYYRFTYGRLRALEEHCRQCAEDIQARGFDLCFVHSTMHFAVPPIGRYLKIPRCLYLQEPHRYLYEASPLLPWIAPGRLSKLQDASSYLKIWLFDIFAVAWLRQQVREELINARSFDRILVNSFFSRESVMRVYNLESHVSYLGIDTKKFVDLRMNRGSQIIGVGAFHPSKRIDLVIKALSLLPKPKPELTWIGNTKNIAYCKELKSLASKLGVDVTFHHNISDNELIILLNQGAMLVYAPRLEPFGYAPLEANACGMAVVAVAEGGMRETVRDGHNGLLVDSNPKALAEGITKLMDDVVLRNGMGKRGREWVESYWSLEKAAEQIDIQLQNTLSEKKDHTSDGVIDKRNYWRAWTG